MTINVFKFLYATKHFTLGTDLYHKLPILTILGAISPYF